MPASSTSTAKTRREAKSSSSGTSASHSFAATRRSSRFTRSAAWAKASSRSEGAFPAERNLLDERDPTKIRWVTLPTASRLAHPQGGGRSPRNKASSASATARSIACTAPSTASRPAATVATAGRPGRTAGTADLRPTAAASSIRAPQTSSGSARTASYLYWFHNHGGQVHRRAPGTATIPTKTATPPGCAAASEADTAEGQDHQVVAAGDRALR